MAVRILATAPNEWSFPYDVELDGREYRVRLHYRQRVNGGSWYLDLRTADGDAIVLGRRLSPKRNPLQGVVSDDAPPGAFVVSGPDPYRRQDLGRSVILAYLTEDELGDPTPFAYEVT